MRASGRLLLSRALQGLGVLLFLTVVTFLASHLTGDPRNVLLSPETPRAQYNLIGHQLGLDRPLVVQYWLYLKRLLHGNLGESIFWQQTVSSVIGARIGYTLRLGLAGMILTLLIAVPMAVLAALHRGGRIDLLLRSVTVIGQSAPTFWIALVLIEIFSVRLGWLPVAGYNGGLLAYVLPAITLALFQTASIVRLLRSAIVEELSSSYVLLARIKGLSHARVVWVHVLRNAAGPALSYAGVEFVRAFLAGSVVVETVFAWPGVGQLVFRSVETRDFPVVEAAVLLFGLMYVCATFLVDVLQVYLNPRLRMAM